jgi:hypothetical protein
MSEGVAGIGSSTSTAPIPLLLAASIKNGDLGLTQRLKPRRVIGFNTRVPLKARCPTPFDGALLQVIENAALPIWGHEVTAMASGPVQPGLELP